MFPETEWCESLTSSAALNSQFVIVSIKNLMLVSRGGSFCDEELTNIRSAERSHRVERIRCGSANESTPGNLTRMFFLTNYRHARFVQE